MNEKEKKKLDEINYFISNLIKNNENQETKEKSEK